MGVPSRGAHFRKSFPCCPKAFPNRLLSPSTWRNLGLGLTTAFVGLGALALFAPTAAADSLGVVPTTPESHAVNEKGMVFLGIRDVAVAAALAWFYAERKDREMGVLTTAWTLVGWDKGIWTLWGGAGVVAFIGTGLIQS
ncbi:hypothetical protein BU23DRAFT_583203 [Bimuria novae-zelandiae CBS 107.79]|uniref:Uncharacterized protein n=1 Tax=Bimuria novae-zelandiae CBS 107.79 TaxID=1447943 RepID=A0A6A5UVS0_9PLEO|nr:hypothetical protein BU23DRAFT_583203 [Bimuria novae-zelandiae CBS 107.79]